MADLKEKEVFEDQNIIHVETEDLGEFFVILTDEQVSILSESGMNFLEKVREEIISSKENEEEEYSNGSYWLPDTIGSEDVVGGFTNNDVDWTSYFPDITNMEIEELIEDAEKRELEIRMATTAGLVFLAVGLTAALGGNPLPASVGLVQVANVVGSYFKDEIGGLGNIFE